MVYHLTFEDMNQLMKHQMMSSSSELPAASSAITSHVPTNPIHRPSSLSENNLLMQCMQKLGQYPPSTSRVVLQESNGQIISTSSAKGEGGDDQHASGGGCTPRPRWCPTPEQIQVLEALFNSGTTTPSRDMIVEIAACLKQFGSIVEANVFYWFQNRKARAKRKLRMQAQLQLQQSASPADSDHSPAQHHNVKVSTTSRRVCAKTTCKSSPNSFAASDHQLPALVHLAATANHADHFPDQHAAAVCNMIVHHHHTDQLAATTHSLLMPPLLYASGDCGIKAPSLQMISNASSCKMTSSSNEELNLCFSSTSTTPTTQSFDSHAQFHQGVSQALPSAITSAPTQLFADHERADHHFSSIQQHIECSQYNHMGSYSPAEMNLPARGCSRPGSADGHDVMIGSSCPSLQHPATSPESTAAAQSAAIMTPHLYNAPAANFSSQNHNQLSAAAANHYRNPASADHYSNPAADHYNSPAAYNQGSSTSYSDHLGSLALPNKRSWMQALMQQFLLSQDSTEPTTNIMPTYEGDHYNTRVHRNEELLNTTHDPLINPIDLNLLLQRPQSLNASQGAPYLPPFTNLTSNSMEPAANSNTMIKESNKCINTVNNKQHDVLAPSPSQAYHHELHEPTMRRDPDNMESNVMCSNPAPTSQQQLATATSPPRFHHCDHLPLWEALAPYMSIGS